MKGESLHVSVLAPTGICHQLDLWLEVYCRCGYDFTTSMKVPLFLFLFLFVPEMHYFRSRDI